MAHGAQVGRLYGRNSRGTGDTASPRWLFFPVVLVGLLSFVAPAVMTMVRYAGSSSACLLKRYCFEISVGPYEDVGTRFPGVVMCQGQRHLQWTLATTALECEKRGKGKIGLAVFWPGHAGHAWHSQTLDGNFRHGKNGGKVMGKRRGGPRPSSPTAAPFSGHSSAFQRPHFSGHFHHHHHHHDRA